MSTILKECMSQAGSTAWMVSTGPYPATYTRWSPFRTGGFVELRMILPSLGRYGGRSERSSTTLRQATDASRMAPRP